MLWQNQTINEVSPRRISRNPSLSKAIVEAKNNLSRKLLHKNSADFFRAVGIGQINQRLCIQVFVKDANNRFVRDLRDNFHGFPLVLFEIPETVFLNEGFINRQNHVFSESLREYHDVIVGGLSAANIKVTNTHGTIGYFCRPKNKSFSKDEVYLLSNSHIFANLFKSDSGASDIITQPGPAELSEFRPVAKLSRFTPIEFENDHGNPNYIDAAIAKLFKQIPYKLLIPAIGKVEGLVEKSAIPIGAFCKKVGRTTGYTEGNIISTNLDIWTSYSGENKKSFFKDQILVAPTHAFKKFVGAGDSGSLVVNAENKAIGLIYAGTDSNTIIENREKVFPSIRLENFGVANPISEVLDKLEIELLI